MGSGKSTIGSLLSKKIDIPFLDIDNEIERLIEMSIETIFNEYGENRFRLIESTFFREITKQNKFVYATGGGIILDPKNQLILKNNGLSIFLDCSVNEIIRRIKNDSKQRPLLNNNFQQTIKKLYKERHNLYKSCAHHIIDVDSLSPQLIINKITDYLNA